MTYGPDLDLVERFSLAQQWAGYGHDERADGLHDRVVAVETFSDLSAEDQAFILEAVRRARAGESFTMPDGDPEGNWTLEDAEFERLEDGAVAADTVLPPAEESEDDITDEDVMRETGDWPGEDERKGFDFDDDDEPAAEDEWVGV